MQDCRELDTQALDVLILLADVHGSQAAATHAAIMLRRKRRLLEEALLDLRQLEHKFERVQQKHEFSEPDTESDDDVEGFRERRRLQRMASEAEVSESVQSLSPQTKRKHTESEDNEETAESSQRKATPWEGVVSE